MTLLDQLRDLLIFTRNAAADLDARGVQRNLSRLYGVLMDERPEIDPEGYAVHATEMAQETILAIIDGAPEWDEIPEAIFAIAAEIDWD
jgi:hypothetical protein